MAPKINVSGPITKTFTSGANATITIGANAMTGATSSADGAAGIVPKPVTGDENKVLRGDGTWNKVGGGNIDWTTVTQTPLVTRVIWGTSISFDLAVGHHAIVIMMAAWFGFVIHHGGGWQLLTVWKESSATAPTYSTSGNTITITSSSDQTWTAFTS
jgi:hypothetical protein